MPDLAHTLASPAWRLENIYKIVDKGSRRVLFSPNSIQRLINASQAKRKMILKARQFGVSTNELLKLLDFVVWNHNVTSCILAHEKDGIEKLFRIVRNAYDSMVPELRPRLDRGGGSKYELYFPEINSRIYCDLESRGDTIHWLHISEAAFADPGRMKSTLQAVPLTGRVTIETTPNGMGNHFYDIWMDPNQPYEKMFFPWFIFPEYTLDSGVTELTEPECEMKQRAFERYGVTITPGQIGFRRMKQAELGLLFAQEYPEDDQGCFLASGNAAMNLVLVKDMLDRAPKPIEETSGLKLYERPKAGGIYVVGADVAEGVGTDYSVGVMIEAKSLRQVAVLRGHWKPSLFAKKLVELCELYRVRGMLPEMAVERNNHGHACILELDEHLSYPNLFEAKDERLGWLTDRISRPLMVDTFIDAVEGMHLTLQDAETLRECLVLVDNQGKIEADVGKHDDCVIAASIALQLALEHSRLSSLYENIGEKILV